MENKDREIELLLEETNLKRTIDIIKKENLNYIDKRKKIAKYILDYRKKAIEEFEDDEDKVIEYFDHERYVKEEMYKAIDKKLKELNLLMPSPYFGRVDFREEEFGVEKIYVGRFGVTVEGSLEPLVVDWRAPIASSFYSGKMGEFSYDSPSGKVDMNILLKRQFVIKKGILEGMFDSAVDVKDDILQMVLSKNSDKKLTDIIMTIQKEQDDLIREYRYKTMVVNGVAGSGKTTIALHRVAYLLYNFRDVLQDKVLILGPNNIFMEYIATVLPSLGEVGVNQKTFKDFALDYLELDSTDVMADKDYMEKLINGDTSFTETTIKKTSKEFINQLDLMVENLIKNQKLEEVKYFDKVIVSKEEIKRMFEVYYKDMPLFRRTNKLRRIIFSKLKDARDERVREIEIEYREILEKASKEELSLNGSKYDFDKKLKIREAIKEVIKMKKTLTWLDNSNVYDVYKNINSGDIYTVDDLAPLLYLRIKLEGIKTKKEIKHVVIDEAQDYSFLQFKVIKEITKCSALTIVGDSNQRIIPLKGELAMLNLNNYLDGMEVENHTLNKSYRSTQQIMEYANNYLKEEKIVPLVRNGEKVVEQVIDNKEDLIDTIKEDLLLFKEKEYENVAIVCKDIKETNEIAKLIKADMYIKVLNDENMLYNGGEIVIPSYLAKGLEFDAVIIIDNKLDNTSFDEDKLKYVMCTRALHELKVIKVENK